MAEKVGLFGTLLFSKWADRAAINANADTLESVESNIADLRKILLAQNDEILHLRAMIVGLAEVLNSITPFDPARLELAVNEAYEEIKPPPPVVPVTDPYRGLPAPDDDPAAVELLAQAQRLHYSKQFKEAKVIYEQVVEKFAATKQGATAKMQLGNLKNV